MANRKPDFSGWATKYGIKCSDGRTILPGAFSDQNGKKVPIVFGHIHDDPSMILGHAYFYSRPEGIWTEGYLNNNPKAQDIRGCLENGDIDGLSIYANELKHVNGMQVQHGNIRELSIVLAGANKGATIESVRLMHGDWSEELEDEAIIYGDDIPLMHSEDENGDDDGYEPESDDGEPDDDGEPNDEGSEDDEPEDDDESEGEDDDGEGEDPEAVYNSLDPAQQELLHLMVAQAYEDGKAEGGESAAEHSYNEEDDDMKDNIFDRNRKPHPDEFLSHSEQLEIIEQGKALGSMRKAWQSALETNETLKHSVFNDDGTEQTYGIANIDYLFPEPTELNNTPELIRRDDEWVSVLMNGVFKTPHGRLKTTVANITMEEARAKGYTKGDKKDPEVFNLLKRVITPQTVYKYDELDQDDLIDITDFEIVAFKKMEMRIMLNEEVARAMLVGDGRLYNDKHKIKEDHIKPVVNDDDLYAIKLTVVPGASGTDDEKAAATAKNAIKTMIRGRKQYKGSGNITMFTSEDWLAEWLLLEDGFGHALYKNVGELATKMRVNRIVTCPFLEDLTVEGQKVMAIAFDLKDYATGTDKRGQIKFFDDFDIEFNKNQYLIETRLSGMLRRPFSAMILKIGANGPHYDEVTPVGNENPKSEGWYEKEGIVYKLTKDTAVNAHKTYYERSLAANP